MNGGRRPGLALVFRVAFALGLRTISIRTYSDVWTQLHKPVSASCFTSQSLVIDSPRLRGRMLARRMRTRAHLTRAIPLKPIWTVCAQRAVLLAPISSHRMSSHRAHGVKGVSTADGHCRSLEAFRVPSATSLGAGSHEPTAAGCNGERRHADACPLAAPPRLAERLAGSGAGDLFALIRVGPSVERVKRGQPGVADRPVRRSRSQRMRRPRPGPHLSRQSRRRTPCCACRSWL